MKNQVGSSRMDTVLKLLMIAFFSLFAFSSGVYFGKQMSDSDYQLKALESDFKSHSNMAGTKGEGAGEKINDEEVAALTDKFVASEKDTLSANAEKTGEKPVAEKTEGDRKVASTETKEAKAEAGSETKPEVKDVEQGEMTAEHAAAKPAPAKQITAALPAAEKAKTEKVASAANSAKKPDLSAAHEAAVRVANNAEPEQEAKPAATEKRTPSSLPRVVGANHDVEFTVQVASYPTLAAAKEHAGQLVKKGFPAFPVEASINGKSWYRVSVGSFKTLKEATAYRGQLLKQAELESAIVQKITR